MRVRIIFILITLNSFSASLPLSPSFIWFCGLLPCSFICTQCFFFILSVLLWFRSLGFPGGSEVKASARNAGDLGSTPWVGKIPWRRKWQPTLVFLAGESHGWRSLMGDSPRGHKGSDTTERLHFHFSLSLSLSYRVLVPLVFGLCLQ